MRRPSRFVIQSGPVLPRESEPDRTRTIEVDGETRELLPLPPTHGESLTWRQPHRFRAVYWLESERGAHLLLHIPGSDIRTPRDCPVEAANGSWNLHLGWGFSRRSLTLRDAGGTELMHHEPGMFGRGHVVLPDGERLPLRRTWSAMELHDRDGQLLVQLRRTRFFAMFRAEASVAVLDSARRRDDLLPLLALTWLALLDSRRHHYY